MSEGSKTNKNPNSRGGDNKNGPPTATAEKNYTSLCIGQNEKGGVFLGGISKDGAVTNAVKLENKQDGEHQFCLEITNNRRSSTTSTSPGRLSLTCGRYPWIDDREEKEALESCLIHAENGNIIIKASNGKIRMEATDIELVTKGEGETRGHLKMDIEETVDLKCKKLITSSQVFTKMCSAGDFETAANGVLSTYASLISNITDAVFGKPSKFGGQRERQQNSLESASPATVASLDRGEPAQQYKPGTNELQ